MKTKFKGILTLLLAFVVQITFAQEKSVSGTVSDTSGTLPGVSVVIKGTAKGTQTDFDGKYTIKANQGDILSFSYVGYKTVNKTVESSNTINVSMTEDDNVLEEVIITALGIEKKKDDDLSSSTTVKAADIQKSGESGVIQGLAGKTSGLKITRNSGDPGAGAFMQIRGQNTILGDGSPLIVVDGVPMSNSSIGDPTGDDTAGVSQQSRLNDINPDDIESVDVLKDASASAIYGTRGANGVIIITTKSGKRNTTPELKYSHYTSFSSFTRTADFLNANDVRRLANEGQGAVDRLGGDVLAIIIHTWIKGVIGV